MEKKTHAEQQNRKKNLKNKESLRNLWDNMKRNNTGIPEESEQGIKNPSEDIMTEKFPNLVKEKDTKVQEAQRVPNKLEPKRPTPRHLIIKVAKLKASKES